MTDESLFRRAQDLAHRCQRSGNITASGFLTPAQCHALTNWAPRDTDCSLLLHGGYPQAERQVAFFLPDWMDAADFDPDGHLCALECVARFGTPGHRDYLGAALGLGIQREWLGDIFIEEQRAFLLCLPSVRQHLLLNLDHVGRWGVKTREIPLAELPARALQLKETVFSVQSPRLDAVCAGAFGLSRSAAAEAVTQGLVNLNYQVCLRPDAAVKAGDVLSLRGRGKATVIELGGRSRKDRLFVKCGRYL